MCISYVQDLKLHINCIELENVARLTAKGDVMAGDGLVTSVDWNHGTWVDRYLCLCPHTRVTQVGFL